MSRVFRICRLNWTVYCRSTRGYAPNLFGAATPGHSSGPFADVYGRVHGQMAAGQVGESMVPVGESNGVAAINSAGVSGALWSSPYDPSVGRR